MNKLLIVDDLEFFLSLAKSLLDNRGLNVLTTTDSKDAFNLIVQEKPQLILLDQYMPEMTGDELCRKIKNTPETKDIYVIMLAASKLKSDIDKCFAAGCNDYITKPIDKESLLDSIGKCLPIAKRAFERVPIYENVTYSLDNNEYSGHIHIVSKGGACLKGKKIMPVDAITKLKFTITKLHTSIEVTGKVVWNSDSEGKVSQSMSTLPEMGIQFINVSENAKSAIVRYTALHNHII